RSASSTLLSRASACNSAMIRRSMASRGYFGMFVAFWGWERVVWCVGCLRDSTVRKDMPGGLMRGSGISQPTTESQDMTDIATHQALLTAVERYLEMMFDCDIGKFDRVFAPTAQLHGLGEEGLRVLPAGEYRERLAAR